MVDRVFSFLLYITFITFLTVIFYYFDFLNMRPSRNIRTSHGLLVLLFLTLFFIKNQHLIEFISNYSYKSFKKCITNIHIIFFTPFPTIYVLFPPCSIKSILYLMRQFKIIKPKAIHFCAMPVQRQTCRWKQSLSSVLKCPIGSSFQQRHHHLCHLQEQGGSTFISHSVIPFKYLLAHQKLTFIDYFMLVHYTLKEWTEIIWLVW